MMKNKNLQKLNYLINSYIDFSDNLFVLKLALHANNDKSCF